MNRRESLKGIGLLAGAPLLPSDVLASFLRSAEAVEKTGEWTPQLVTARQARLLPELVETIIPTTDTPGARDALVHVFVDLYVKDCYPAAQREAFLKGFDEVDKLGFLDLSPQERLALLVRLERESMEKNEPEDQSFVRMLKRVTLLGYFSSKPGATQAAEYVQSPGPFEGCVDLKPKQRVQALQ